MEQGSNRQMKVTPINEFGSGAAHYPVVILDHVVWGDRKLDRE